MERRSFIRQTGTIAAGLAVAQPFAIGSTRPARQLKIGLIGCGDRGSFISDKMLKHGGYKIVAAADYFEDRLETYADKFSLPRTRLFNGLDGYRKLLEDKEIEAVAIMSPPYFHPEQARAAVVAGKHVYLSKPIAVDVPGSLSVGDSGEKATRKGLCFLVDFQTRADPSYQEAIKLVHECAIGEFSFGESYYHAGNPFENRPGTQMLRQDPQNPEHRLRAWGLDKILSGDIITEQNIHTLDVSSWMLQENPVKAFGNCSGKTRDVGDCNDHFSVVFHFSDDVDVAFHSRQFRASGTKPDGIYNRMFGTNGALETKYSGPVILRGKPSFRGDSANLYSVGAETNVDTFHQDVTNADAANPTVSPSVKSTLLTILGREAAYRQEVLLWDALMQENKRLEANLELKA